MPNTVRANIAASLSKIGQVNGTKSPPSKNNSTPILHEFFVAKTLKSLAEKREELAKNAFLQLAKDQGENLNITAGDSGALFTENPDYVVTLRVNNASDKVDIKGVIASLIKQGVKLDVINKAIKSATSMGTPAKVYTIVPIEG